VRGEAHVPLSAFRSIERLPGAAHPAVFRVRFDCGCGSEHDGLLTHEELDWAPLGLRAGEFVNLMTARLDSVATELGELAAVHIKRGEWPWSFFCYPEEQARPVFPSSFAQLTATYGPVGLAVRCPSCRRLSLNLVSRPHVDVPFHNDREIGVVEHVFAEDALATLTEFREELLSASFDVRRLALE
jgi:hypothetical protein